MSELAEQVRKIEKTLMDACDKLSEMCAAYVDQLAAGLEWCNDCGKLIPAGVTHEEWMRLSAAVRQLVILGLETHAVGHEPEEGEG